MAAAVAVNPTSPRVKLDATMISCSGIPSNTLTGYDATKYPSSPAVVYYFKASKAGQDDLVSHLFTPNGGKHVWMDVVFPAAGSWTVGLFNFVGDTQVATASITVQ